MGGITEGYLAATDRATLRFTRAQLCRGGRVCGQMRYEQAPVVLTLTRTPHTSHSPIWYIGWPPCAAMTSVGLGASWNSLGSRSGLSGAWERVPRTSAASLRAVFRSSSFSSSLPSPREPLAPTPAPPRGLASPAWLILSLLRPPPRPPAPPLALDRWAAVLMSPSSSPRLNLRAGLLTLALREGERSSLRGLPTRRFTLLKPASSSSSSS